MTLREAVNLLTPLQDRDRLEMLVSFGDTLPRLSQEMRHEQERGKHIVAECQTPVYLRVDRREGRVSVYADAPREAAVVRGFLALLVTVFDGCTVAALRRAPKDILSALGLDQVLSLTRTRGLAATYRRVLAAASCRVAAIILAAGSSSRMPLHNKLLLEVDGLPLVVRTVRTVVGSDASSVTVVLGPDSADVRTAIETHLAHVSAHVRFVVNADASQGMTTSIQSGVRRVLADDVDGCLICPADQPFLKESDVNLIVQRFAAALAPSSPVAAGGPIVVPFSSGLRGNPVVFAASYFQRILEHDEPDGCRGIVAANPGSVVRAELPSPDAFWDIDTEADLNRISPTTDRNA